MKISNNLLNFLKDPGNQDLIKKNNFEKLYENAFNQPSWSGFKVSELTEMLYAIDIDPLLYSNNKIPKGFLKESHRKKFEIPEYINRIEDEAFSKSELVDMIIPTNVKSLGNDVFFGCIYLINMVIPDNVNDIGVGIFANCQSLTNVTLSKNVTIIKNFMFASCFKLTDIVIPDGVVKIGMAAFKDCTNLTRVVIPDSVVSIGQDAFKGCGSLKNIYYKGTGDQWREIKRLRDWDPPVPATIHCNDIDIYL